MTYIWQKKFWPDFTWDSDKILKPLGNTRFKQGALLSKMRDLGFEDKQAAQAEILVNEAIKTSEIEGEMLDPKAVRSSVAKRLGLPVTEKQNINNNKADGVVDILLDATTHYKDKLNTDRLFSWHAALFPTGYSGLFKIKVADWRDDSKGAMQVVSGPTGREQIHYEAPPARRIEKEIIKFLGWVKSSKNQVDGIIRAGIVHLWFVAIHPFEDGNGRIARALTEMMLAQDEDNSVRFYSLSSQIMSDRNEYYNVLEHIHRGDGDITEWLLWFLECMQRAISKTDTLLINIIYKTRFWNKFGQTEFNHRQIKVINRLLESGPGGFEGGMKNRKYANITHTSRATAQRELSDLVSKGVLCKNPGGGRSVSYDLVSLES